MRKSNRRVGADPANNTFYYPTAPVNVTRPVTALDPVRGPFLAP